MHIKEGRTNLKQRRQERTKCTCKTHKKTAELYLRQKVFCGCMVDALGVHNVHACMLLSNGDKVDCAMSFDG